MKIYQRLKLLAIFSERDQLDRSSLTRLIPRVITFLIPATIGVLLLASSAALAGTADGLGTNGQHPRPFYIFAHNPNTLDEVT